MTIIWTHRLARAAGATATDFLLSPETMQRAEEIARNAKVGQALTPTQLSLVQALRSRLGDGFTGGGFTGREFEAAFSEAWNAPVLFDLTCMRLLPDNTPQQYVERVTVKRSSGKRDHWYATSPKWGCSRDYPSEPQNAAQQLAYANAASVRKVEQVAA